MVTRDLHDFQSTNYLSLDTLHVELIGMYKYCLFDLLGCLITPFGYNVYTGSTNIGNK